jgi:hypothetical protein
MSYVESIVAKDDDSVSAALELHCIIEGIDEEFRTEAEKTVADIMRLQGEVANGGFDQYFFNSGVHVARRALAHLEQVRAEDAANLLRRAIDVVALPVEVPNTYVYEASDQALSILKSLDASFWDLEETICERVVSFALNNASEFGAPRDA